MSPARPFQVRRVVVKVGTSIVTRGDGRLALGRLGALVEELHALHQHAEVVLVTSGSIGLGAARLGYDAVPSEVVDRQACAAAGQGALIATYDALFRQLDLAAAQVLLTEDDFLHRRRYLNLRATLERLVARGAVPVVNENDTVSTLELACGRDRVFGDNDRLSALVAARLDADLLVLLTDVDGVYTAAPGTPDACRIDTWQDDKVSLGPGSALGRGGMGAKLRAARMAQHVGVHVVIASGFVPGVLGRVVAGDVEGTWFPAQAGLSQRGRWLAYASAPDGRITVDAGAREAILSRGASLLPVGVTQVEGDFSASAIVSLIGPDGTEFARGVAASDARSARARCGQSGERALIHRDDIVFLQLDPEAQ